MFRLLPVPGASLQLAYAQEGDESRSGTQSPGLLAPPSAGCAGSTALTPRDMPQTSACITHVWQSGEAVIWPPVDQLRRA